jgi:hypothetical protein
MTTWTPDTCECVIEYTDDGQFTHVTSHRLCVKHAGLRGQVHLDGVLGHNQKRNKVIEHALKAHGLDKKNKVRGDLSGPNISAQYDADDVLVLTGLPPDTPVKQSELDALFGHGKVRIG